MRDHPLTPMRDPSPGARAAAPDDAARSGWCRTPRSREAPAAIRAAFDALRARRVPARDRRCDRRPRSRSDRRGGGRSAADHRRLGHRARPAGEFPPPGPARRRRRRRRAAARSTGAAAVLSGSCSEATRAQVAYMRGTRAGLHDRPARGGRGQDVAGAGARLGDAAARRAADPGLGHAPPDDGRRRAASGSAASAPERWSRTSLARIAPRPGRARRAAARRRRRRDRRARSCRRSASPACASAARSIPACRGRVEPRRAAAGAGAQIRQFRRARFLPARLRRAEMSSAMNETQAREAICALGASIFNRGLTAGSSGNISVRVDGRLADDADQRLARPARPGAAVEARRRRQARRRRPADQGELPAPRHVRGARRDRRGRASAFDAFGRGLVPRRDRPRTTCCRRSPPIT